MAITGVKTGLTSSADATTGSVKTGLIWYTDNGTTKGPSNVVTGDSSSYLGKALNSAGSKSAEREVKVAVNSIQAPE